MYVYRELCAARKNEVLFDTYKMARDGWRETFQSTAFNKTEVSISAWGSEILNFWPKFTICVSCLFESFDNLIRSCVEALELSQFTIYRQSGEAATLVKGTQEVLCTQWMAKGRC